MEQTRKLLSSPSSIAKPPTQATESQPNFELTLTFEGNRVTSSWYNPVCGDVICRICGKNCKALGKPLCVNVNPYCG
jgi:hypothetical protein